MVNAISKLEINKINMFKRFGNLFFSNQIEKSFNDIIGNEEQKKFIKEFFNALKRFNSIKDQLKISVNLSMLLVGPPGTGKTTIIKAAAKEYNIPILIIEPDRFISSLFGDTLKNLREIFELSINYTKEFEIPFILFFDELDMIASERGNIHEIGEVKRLVDSFLQMIDATFIQKIPLAIIGATNHQDLLDSAVWRRFTYHLIFNFPDLDMRKAIFKYYLNKLKESGIDITNLETEFETFFIEGADLTEGYTGADIERAFQIILLKALGSDMTIFSDTVKKILILVGGTKKHVENQKLLSGQILSKNESISQKEKGDENGPTKYSNSKI
ncbi:MAG: AAA family ATPase [Candidatus Helarchaeota archaeon]